MVLPEPLLLIVPLPQVGGRQRTLVTRAAADGTIAICRIAVLIANAMDTTIASRTYAQLSGAGALPGYTGRRLGRVGAGDDALPVAVAFAEGRHRNRVPGWRITCAAYLKIYRLMARL